MTNEKSKESKSEKQVEGDTDFSWDHEGLEPHSEPERPKPPRSPKLPRVPKSKIKDEQLPPKGCPRCKGDHEEKDCAKFLFRKGKEEIIPPKMEKQVPEANKSEKKPKEKWELTKESSPIDKDTEK